jgi:hypothetical protein
MSRIVAPLAVALLLACGGESAPPQSPANPAADAPPPGTPAADAPADGAPNAILAEHNRLRALHCAPPLAWSPALEKSAQAWADHLKGAGCDLDHSPGPHGENLAAGSIGAMDGPAVVRYWYDESAHYAFAKGGFSSQTGHFTQVVWAGTHEVGCGNTQCEGMDLWVCQYDPPGNMQGAFGANVKPKGCPN